MTKPIVQDSIYRRRRFDAELVELCVRWYITYRWSYRDLVAMMAERGIVVSHTTIPSLGDSLCAGVRKAMEPLRTAREYFLAYGRNLLSLSRCRQARQDGGFSASARPAGISPAPRFRAPVKHQFR